MKRARGMFQGLAWWVLIAIGAGAAWADAPRIVKTIPADGAVDVSTRLEQIVILFDRNMKMNSYSVLVAGDLPVPPLLPDDEPWETPLRFVLKLRELQPNTRYAFQLNSATKKGFQSAEDQTPLPPTVITFTTGAGPEGAGMPPPETTDRPLAPGPSDFPASPPETSTGSVGGGSAGQPLVLHFDQPSVGAAPATLVGTWLTRTPEFELRAVLGSDGTFTRQFRTAEGGEFSRGRYQASGDMLMVYPDGEEPLRFRYRLLDPSTLEVVDEDGEGVQMIRQGETPPAPSSSVPSYPAGPNLGTGTVPPPSAVTGRRPTVVFQRQWERNERAFSLLAPQGWTVEGGIFYVNPLQTQGPGNSLAPKGDLTVRKDPAGSVMCRWLPTWNYADFSVEPPPAAGLFPVGSWYQGMQVKPMPTAEGFLQELFASLRPGATEVRVVARDDFPEIQQAYRRLLQPVNQELMGLGKRPMQFDVLGLTVDYTEQGVRYHEGLFTIIVDLRGGAFQWYNDLTYIARAPAAEADAWRPILETIRASVRFNPDWLRAVRQAMGERAEMALETQRHINRVAQEIQENRSRTQAAINHENYLFLSGQEEYVNPYTREVERDTSDYQHRWVNPNGDYLYTDEATFNPNQERTLNQVEWKKTPVRPR